MDAELEQFKALNLSQYATRYGYQLDHRESSRNSAVMRRPTDGDKIIIARQGPHWVYFSVRDDTDHGSVLDFVMRREACSLGRARQVLRQWSGSPPPVPPIHYAHRLDPITRDRAAVLREYARLTPAPEHPALLARALPAALMAAALEKMPRPAVVILATDNDPAGHALAATIQSLAPPLGGLEFGRPLPDIGKDWNDQLQARRTAARAAPSFPTARAPA